MTRQTLIIIVIVLALVGGIAFVNMKDVPQVEVQPEATDTVSPKDGISSDTLIILEKNQADTVFKNLSFKDASTKEGQVRLISAIKALATTSDEIVVKNCVPSPRVLLISKDDGITIRNVGTSTIDVRLRREVSRTIVSGGVVTVRGIYEASNTFYTYSCNGRGPVGAVYIVE